ncbi:hypothetical protein [uncultured Ruminococcus sp.]|uniref:hypothetical protein n=1 Tax=uncultured Ruminococcus sp. TaxID=165186 RepID=UPI0025F764B7|nr:hypothetical protein [uncultured Ruminococcus sp.]
MVLERCWRTILYSAKKAGVKVRIAHCHKCENKGEGIFHALITWSSSAASYAEWDYPLIFVEDRLICDGNGIKTGVEYENAESEPKRTVEYTDGSAEFTLEGNRLFWNDLKEHRADDMLFRK